MAASKGRDLVIKRGVTAIAGVRQKSISANGEPIDITSDDDNGFRTLLDMAGTQSIDLSIEGVTKDADLRGVILTGGTLMLSDISIEYANGDTLTGDFFLASVEETAPHADAVTFSASLQSSGAWVYTPA